MIIYSKTVAARMHDDIDPSKFGTEIYYYTDASTGSYKLQLKNEDGMVLSEVDCADFISDGMVESVDIVDDNIVITFNTDAGKQDISIPLTDIFDPSNYYTADQTDGRIDDAIANLGLGDASTHNVDTSISSQQTPSSNLPTSDAVKSYVIGQGYAQTANLGAAAYVGVDTSIPASGTSSNLPTSDAVKAYAYSKAEVDDYIASVTYDDLTRTFTFIRGDGTSFTVTIA